MIIFRRVFHKNNIENWEQYKRKTIKSISSFLKIKKISCSIDFLESFRESQLGLALLYHVFSIESHFVFYAMEPVRVTDGMSIEQPAGSLWSDDRSPGSPRRCLFGVHTYVNTVLHDYFESRTVTHLGMLVLTLYLCVKVTIWYRDKD